MRGLSKHKYTQLLLEVTMFLLHVYLINTDIYTYIHIYIHIYIHPEREKRERERRADKRWETR